MFKFPLNQESKLALRSDLIFITSICCSNMIITSITQIEPYIIVGTDIGFFLLISFYCFTKSKDIILFDLIFILGLLFGFNSVLIGVLKNRELNQSEILSFIIPLNIIPSLIILCYLLMIITTNRYYEIPVTVTQNQNNKSMMVSLQSSR